MLLTGLPIVAAAFALRPQIFEEFGPGLTCVYNSVPAADLLVAEAIERERRPPTSDEAAALARVNAISQACADEHFWTPNRTMAAVIYAIGWAMREKAVQALRARGVDFHFLDDVAAELGEGGVAALMASTSDSNLDLAGNVAMRRLAARGHRISPGSEEWTRLGREIARGLVGQTLSTRATMSFSHQ